ncbi:hypothetical protein WIT60_16035 [Aquabacterium sp. G14]|uniref:hypothetical protein n=1 Tax=Aquabacterium sp. G14 TaxID=3130164 RepID=UPI0030A98E48
MNDRYGVDPCAASTFVELASLLRLFGPEHGRFIVEFPLDWPEEVRNAHIDDLDDLSRARLTEILLRFKNSLLPASTRYSEALSWVQNAQQLRDVQGLIGPVGSRPPIQTVFDVLTDPKALPDCSGAHIPRTPNAYAEAARPLFQISKKVVLIDRYLRLRDLSRIEHRYVRTLKALIKAAQAEKVDVFKLMVNAEHARIHIDDGAQFKADLEMIQCEVGASDIKIEYGFLESHSLDSHPRYLLGNECGLSFDWGFEVKDATSTCHVEWVGRAALKPLLERFMQATSLARSRAPRRW